MMSIFFVCAILYFLTASAYYLLSIYSSLRHMRDEKQLVNELLNRAVIVHRKPRMDA